MDKFHISSTGHAVNYFPEYLARELGYYADVKLEVKADVPQMWTRVLDDLNTGTAQAALGGIWVPSMYHSRVRDYYAFAQISARCPLALITRDPIESFEWRCLEDKIILVPGGNGASPFLFFDGLLKRAGFDLSRVKFVHDLSSPMLSELFAGGMGDTLVADPVTAALLVRKGIGYHAASLAEIGGAIPWSVYYTLPEVIERDDNLVGRFTSAIQRATTWIREHKAEDAREVVRKYWPTTDTDLIITIIDFFRANGMWAETVQIEPQPLNGWQEIIADAGLVDRPLRYDEVIDTRPYDFAATVLR